MKNNFLIKQYPYDMIYRYSENSINPYERCVIFLLFTTRGFGPINPLQYVVFVSFQTRAK